MRLFRHRDPPLPYRSVHSLSPRSPLHASDRFIEGFELMVGVIPQTLVMLQQNHAQLTRIEPEIVQYPSVEPSLYALVSVGDLKVSSILLLDGHGRTSSTTALGILSEYDIVSLADEIERIPVCLGWPVKLLKRRDESLTIGYHLLAGVD